MHTWAELVGRPIDGIPDGNQIGIVGDLCLGEGMRNPHLSSTQKFLRQEY
jgi:hypothetical protein